MKFYVASSFHRHAEVRVTIDKLTAAGHEVTHDWTRTDEFVDDEPVMQKMNDPLSRKKYAIQDRDGVLNADALVYLPDEQNYGALIEIGVGIGNYVEIWIIGPPVRNSIFYELDTVRQFTDLDELIAYAVLLR